MQEKEIKVCPLTRYLKLIEADHQDAQLYLKPENANRFAEVTNMYRFHDLIHRDEYRPVAVIRFHRHGESYVRVYFQQLQETSVETNCAAIEGLSPSNGVLAGAS